MVAETLALLAPSRGGLFVDCTVGLGGHTRALLEAGASRILGLDRDRDALRHRGASARRRSATASSWCTPTTAISPRVLDERGLHGVDGALADLGVSSMQLEAEGRGFSFRRDEPLDMRMDQLAGPDRRRPARDGRRGVARQRDLRVRRGAVLAADRARRSSRRAQLRADPRRPAALAQVVRRAIPRRGYQRIDPATRTFQALRIWVNRELEGLERFLQEARAAAAAAARGSRSSRFTRSRIGSSSTRSARSARGEAALRVLTKRPDRSVGRRKWRATRGRAAPSCARSRGSHERDGFRVRDQEGRPEQPDRPRSRRGPPARAAALDARSAACSSSSCCSRPGSSSSWSATATRWRRCSASAPRKKK